MAVKGGGQTFFRAFINSELGLPEVAPCMARTFGGVSGHRRRTANWLRATPRPNMEPEISRYMALEATNMNILS